MAEFKDSWLARILNLELQEQEARFTLASTEEKLASISEIKARVAGKVINFHKNAGEINQGWRSPLPPSWRISQIIKKKQLFIYQAILEKGKTGMIALISPTIVKKEEYGSIMGVVEEVSDFSCKPSRNSF